MGRTIQLTMVLFMGLVFFYLSPTVFAHPGRTDSSGGHTCRTNCPSWGLNYGEYHYHNGGRRITPPPPPPNYYLQGLTNGRVHADREAENIRTTSRSLANQEGYRVGSLGQPKRYFVTAPNSICEISFKFNAGTSEAYKSAYASGWKSRCNTIANSVYQASYDKGYAEGAQARSEPTVAGESIETNDATTSDDNWWLWIIGGLIALGVIGWVTDSMQKKEKSRF